MTKKRKRSSSTQADDSKALVSGSWAQLNGPLLLYVDWIEHCRCAHCAASDVVVLPTERGVEVSMKPCDMRGVLIGEVADFMAVCSSSTAEVVRVAKLYRLHWFLAVELSVNYRLQGSARKSLSTSAHRKTLAFVERHVDCLAPDLNLCGPFSQCGTFSCTSCVSNERTFSLNNIFKGVRPPITDEIFNRRGSYMIANAAHEGPSLPHVPELAIVKILSCLNACDLRMMSCVCLYLRDLVKDFIPGLRLPLFAHQRLALSWMIEREQAGGHKVIHPPHVVPLATNCRQQLYLDSKSGEISTTAESEPDCSGGLLCDEPGLGKTITMLALILKRRNMLPDKPSTIADADIVACLVRHFFKRLEATPCQNATAQTFAVPVAEQYGPSALQDYDTIIPNAMDLRTVREKAMKGNYFNSFGLFQKDMDLIVENARLYNGDNSHVGKRAMRLKEFFQWWCDDQEKWLIESFSGKFGTFPAYSTDETLSSENTDNETFSSETTRHTSHRRSRGSTPTKEIVLQGRRPQWVNPSMGPSVVFLSAATVVVAPSFLLGHWEEQLDRHVSEPKLRLFRARADDLPLAPVMANSFDLVLVSNERVTKEHFLLNSPLFSVRWARVVVDEGHSLGSSLSLSSRRLALESLNSQSKWVMTGTPTPNTRGSDIPHLSPLLSFVGDRFYGKNRPAWLRIIQQPFEQRQPEGVFRLHKLLPRIMIRNSKEHVGTLPELQFKSHMIRMYKKQAQSYNELVSITQRNLLLSEFYDPNHEDSLMCTKNRVAASTCISNIRKNCNVAGIGGFLPNRKEIHETVEEIRKIDPSFDSEAKIVEGLQNGSDCEVCSHFVIAPIATPCGHLLCLDCASLSKTHCPKCSKTYALDSKGIPEQLIEIQPSYHQEEWTIDECQNRSAKADFLLKRIREEYYTARWDAVKQKYEPQKRKMIVFSQFLEHIYLISSVLLREGISRAVNVKSMNRSQRLRSLRNFEQNQDVSVLVTDSSGALGHDFSFVSRIFLMEPVWDASLELQMVSRAHRIGAKEVVLVEKFVSVDTIEAPILKNRDTMDGASTKSEKAEQEHRRFCSVLMGLRRVPLDSQVVPKEEEETTFTIKGNESLEYGWTY